MPRLHTTAANPFALMMDPQSVLDAMERSERLKRLQSRVCRPLDKPLLGPVQGDLIRHDAAIDAEPFSDED
ncbi:MAG: hypothetical protein ACK4ZD_07740 [Caldimonas sp.]|uniref:hypothetical protein n=1 Tax=Caldimonas sp. TaxID=2838790 RepID=UPI00391CA8DB